MAEIVRLYESNCRDVVATLRRIADNIESGDYGEVLEAAVVINGSNVEVFGIGESDAGTTNLLLDAAKLKIGLACLGI